MTTRLYIIRHGATKLSSEDRFSGATDINLSEEGRWQAGCLAERLEKDRIAAIYTSPMKRTVETAAIIARSHALKPIFQDNLREIHHGHWETMRRVEVETNFPEEYAAWQIDPFTFAPIGGESGLNVMARALPIIRNIVIKHHDENIILVSHKATIRLLISSLLGFDSRGYRDRLDQLPACLNILDFKDPVHARLMLFNDVSHYIDYPPYPEKHLSKWWDTQVTRSEENS